MIDIKAIIEEFLNPASRDTKRASKNDRVHDLREKARKGQIIKDALKSAFWQDIERDRIVNTLQEGIGTLLRPSALSMSEVEIKVILAKVQANLSAVADMRWMVDEGDKAAIELERIIKK